MSKILEFILGLLGIPPKADTYMNRAGNNGGAAKACAPTTHIPVEGDNAGDSLPVPVNLGFSHKAKLEKPTVTVVASRSRRGTPIALLVSPKRARVTSNRGNIRSHRIVGRENGTLFLQRAGHPNGPVFRAVLAQSSTGS